MLPLALITPRAARPMRRESKRQRPALPLPAIRNSRTYLACGGAGIVASVALSYINIISVVASATSVALIVIATALIVSALWPRKKETLIIKRHEHKQRTHVHIIHES